MEFLLLLDASNALNSRDILLLLNEYFSIAQVGKYEKKMLNRCGYCVISGSKTRKIYILFYFLINCAFSRELMNVFKNQNKHEKYEN